MIGDENKKVSDRLVMTSLSLVVLRMVFVCSRPHAVFAGTLANRKGAAGERRALSVVFASTLPNLNGIISNETTRHVTTSC